MNDDKKEQNTNTDNKENDDYINDIIGDMDNNENSEHKENFQEKAVMDMIVSAISEILHVLSQMTGLKSMELTPDDKTSLSEALKPFASDFLKYLYLLKYLPIIIFSLGYTLRVITEIKDKKEAKKKKETVINHD